MRRPHSRSAGPPCRTPPPRDPAHTHTQGGTREKCFSKPNCTCTRSPLPPSAVTSHNYSYFLSQLPPLLPANPYSSSNSSAGCSISMRNKHTHACPCNHLPPLGDTGARTSILSVPTQRWGGAEGCIDVPAGIILRVSRVRCHGAPGNCLLALGFVNHILDRGPVKQILAVPEPIPAPFKNCHQMKQLVGL